MNQSNDYVSENPEMYSLEFNETYEYTEADNEFSLTLKEDYDDYYINPSFETEENSVYVPCGYGKSDNGFFIRGIEKTVICENPNANVYALVYNFLIRNSFMSKDDIPKFLQYRQTTYEIDYQSVYRLVIILLQLIRHNYTKSDTVTISYQSDREPVIIAEEIINHYCAIFCRLMGVPVVNLKVKFDKNAVPVSLKQGDGIYCENNKNIVSNARELWFGRKINYNLTKDNFEDLKYLLSEISIFDNFKEGQFSVLCDMLGCEKHSVCIMPTGSGKSLIFYLISLLQPLPLFIVSPTDILIEDQIRNLKKFHHIDNVAHLKLTDKNSFSNWEICNSLNYITPMTFQNRNLLQKFRYLNSGTKLFNNHEVRIASGALVSYIVLDEIHCLSNWGHDFRPEYLMLSKYLNRFLDHISFLGFTATANFTVVEDVQRQLNIPEGNFFSPIEFEKFNVSYNFRALSTEKEMLMEIASITKQLISRNERTIVFTKSEEISERVADAIGWEADVFYRDNKSSYYNFATEESKILVVSDELGVGINFPNVRNIIHFGLPLSKSEYVQEIGRAGRANERVKSYILFLDPQKNAPNGLLMRNTPIKNLPSLLEGYDNDYVHAYKKLSDGAVNDKQLLNQLLETYNDFDYNIRASYEITYPYDVIEFEKKKLYMLYVIGYINDWYSKSVSDDGIGVDIFVDICSSNYESYKRDNKKMLNRVKETVNKYFVFMGNNRESISKINRAKTIIEVIEIYVNWYYEKYLYHHNEQFIDFVEFVLSSLDSGNDIITEEIKDYFVLPFTKLKSDESFYNELSVGEIISKIAVGLSKGTLINLERINSNRYSYKVDLALFCGQLRVNGVLVESRYNRIISSLNQDEIVQFRNAFVKLYASCNVQARFDVLKFMKKHSNDIGITYDAFVESIYNNGYKDEIYYAVMARKLNKYFENIKR